MRITPYRLVFTGGPFSGKSTTARLFAGCGYTVVPDAAEVLLAGADIAVIRADEGQFSKRVLELRLQAEAGLAGVGPVVLDRAVPDSIVYYEFDGLDTQALWEYGRRIRYDGVFCFDNLPLVMGSTRNEFDAQQQAQIGKRLGEVYQELGYRVVRVPVLTPEERMALIMSRIGDER